MCSNLSSALQVRQGKQRKEGKLSRKVKTWDVGTREKSGRQTEHGRILDARQWACEEWIAHKRNKKGNLSRYSDRMMNRIKCNSEHLKAIVRIELDNLKTGKKVYTLSNGDESSMMTSTSDTPKPRLIMGGCTTKMVYGVHGVLTGYFHPCERAGNVVTLLYKRLPNT